VQLSRGFDNYWLSPERGLLMMYCFDIDGTICTNTNGKYGTAVPYPERISHIKRLLIEGNQVIFFTARGSTTGIDWRELTTDQLLEWGIPNPIIFFGKPDADIFIDDKASNSEIYTWDEKSNL